METSGQGLPFRGMRRKRRVPASTLGPRRRAAPVPKVLPAVRTRSALLMAVAFVLLAVWIVRRFLEPIAWASVVAVVTWPLYRQFTASLGRPTSSTAAALTFTALMAAFVFLPVAFAMGALLAEAAALLVRLGSLDQTGLPPPGWLHGVPLVGHAMDQAWQVVLGTPGGISAWLQRADASALVSLAHTLGRFMERHVFIGVFTVFALVFVYRGGEDLARSIRRVLEARLGPRAPRYTALALRAIRATVGGMALLALFDGVAAGILYAVAGVPHPAAWGAVTGLLAMLPFVGYAVIAGVSTALAMQGAAWSGLVVALCGSLVVFVGDKIIRPLAVGSAVKLNLFWVLIGSLGGFEVMGLIGLFVGPVVLALCAEMWRECVPEDAKPAPPIAAAAWRADGTPTLR